MTCTDSEDPLVDQSDDTAHTGGQCACATNADWDQDAYECICADGYYSNENACSECSAISANDDPLIQTTSAEHRDGMCDCVDNAEWNSETMMCACVDGYYADGNACADCSAGGDPLIEMNNPQHMDGMCNCVDNAVWDTETMVCGCQ